MNTLCIQGAHILFFLMKPLLLFLLGIFPQTVMIKKFKNLKEKPTYYCSFESTIGSKIPEASKS